MKFNIIIPTRERADVLAGSLRTAVLQDYDNLEIIVCDNFSNDNTIEIVESFRDPRIKYINTGRRLSMSHNWEFALSHVSGGWITILGDDDGLLADSINTVAEIVHSNSVEAIQSRGCMYLWPSLTQTGYGRLSVNLRQDIELRESKEWFKRVINGDETYTALPNLYTGGFISHNLIKRAQGTARNFYHSMMPDVYSALVLPQFTDYYIYSHKPLAVAGASKHSTGASSFSKGKSKDHGNAPADIFFREPNIPFHGDLPLLPDGSCPKSAQALVFESLLQSYNLVNSSADITSHGKQLEIIMRNSKRQHREETIEWAKHFANMHGIDFDTVYNSSRRGRLRYKIIKNLKNFKDQYHTVNISGTSDLPMRDIYEASIVAAIIMKIKPNKMVTTMKKIVSSSNKLQ
jgi:glycosyltransferase involved in cell wall biosynthesis